MKGIAEISTRVEIQAVDKGPDVNSNAVFLDIHQARGCRLQEALLFFQAESLNQTSHFRRSFPKRDCLGQRLFGESVLDVLQQTLDDLALAGRRIVPARFYSGAERR